ncbi:nestin [Podarcis muralis]
MNSGAVAPGRLFAAQHRPPSSGTPPASRSRLDLAAVQPGSPAAMEAFVGSRALGEESLQMWDLNKRLEAYLSRVKHLEEENEGLRAEVQGLRLSPVEGSWRARYEGEVAALRATLEQAFRDKASAELARDALRDEVQQATGRCQRERAARDEAKRMLSRSRKELEEERRAQLWLREKAAQLEQEVRALDEAHRDEKAALGQEAAGGVGSLQSGRRGAPTAEGCFQPAEVEDYAQRLSSIWKGAAETYKAEVWQLEAALGEAKEKLWRAAEGNRQGQLRLQQLEKELAGLKIRKEVLEESLAQQWQQQHGEAGQLQLAIESLEEEKQSLRVQIAQVLEERQQLMHLKMSLSLEVATYRTLLEAESTRLQIPAGDFKLISGIRDGKLELSNGLSLDRGPLGPRDPWLSPATFPKASAKPRSPRGQNESSAGSFTSSAPPKSKSPLARDFQKASTILPDPSAISFEDPLPAKDVLAPVDLPAFEQTEVWRATQITAVSQSLLHESLPPFDTAAPDGLEESSLGTEQRLQVDGAMRGGRETEAGEKEGLCEEEEEEEEEEEQEEECLSNEPAVEATTQNGPYPDRLVTEAVEIALKVVNAADVRPETGFLEGSDFPNGLPLDGSPPLEDEGRADSPPSTELVKEAAEKVLKEHTGDTPPGADLMWGNRGSEEPTEVNGSPSEACTEEHEGETQGALATDPPTPQEMGLPEVEGEAGETADRVPVTGRIEAYQEVVPLGEEGEEPPPSCSREQGGHGSEEVPECPEGAGALGKDVAVAVREGKESWDPGASSPPEEQAGATGGYLEEAEDLEVVSTEALHLSEDEERRELWSPSKENEEEDLQALEGELLQAEECVACENVAPLSHVAAESCSEQPFLQLEQAQLQAPGAPPEGMDLALREGEVGEASQEPDAVPVEETPLAEENSVREEGENMEGEPRMVESTRDAEGGKERGEEGEDTPRPPREDGLGNEDAREKQGFSDTEPVCSQEMEVALRGEGVPGQGQISKAEEQDVAGDASEEQQQQLAEEEEGAGEGGEEIPAAALDADRDIQEGRLVVGPEASKAEREEEEEAGILEMEEIAAPLETKDLPWCPEAEQGEADAQAEEEEQAVARVEEVLQSQLATHLGESLAPPADKEVEVPPEVQGSPTDGFEGKDQADTSYGQSQSESLGSEDSLESWDSSPNASHETEGIEKGLESGKAIMLEETLPDHTPLHLYEGQMLAASGEPQQTPPESQEAAELPLVTQDGATSLEEVQHPPAEDDSLHSPPTEENINKQEGAEEEGGCAIEAAPIQGTDDPKVSGKPTTDALELIGSDGNLLEEDSKVLRGEEVARDSAQLDAESEKELAGGEGLQKGGEVEEEAQFVEQFCEEEPGQDFAWGPEEDSTFQVERLDPSNVEENAFVEGDGPLELGDQGDTEAEGGHKVSPLTSVADLGEIVLEGEEGSLDVQGGDLTGPEAPACGKDEDLPCAQETTDLEICRREDQFPQEDVAEGDPSGEDLPGETVASISRESMKDADILEIVEQALEFNQELIKAAEPCVEAQPTVTGGEEGPSLENEEEESRAAPIALPDVSDSQVPTEAPEISFPDAKDPTGSGPLWADSNANGLQQDFTEEILNGIGVLQPGETECNGGISEEEPMKKVTITQQFLREELDDPSAVEVTADKRSPQVPSHEETPRIEDVEPEVHEKVLLGHGKGLEATDPNENLFVDILQAACVKGGKGADPGAVSVPPHFGDEVLHLESNQHLNFRTEEEEEQRWSSEDN